MRYPPYSKKELWDIIFNPRKISADPFKLFAAMVFDNMLNICRFNEEKDTITKGEIFDALVNFSDDEESCSLFMENMIDDFLECIYEKKQITLSSGPYTIRNSKYVTDIMLRQVFNFRTDHNLNKRLTEGSVLDVSKKPLPETMAEQKRITDANRKRAMEIFYIGQTDEGWEKLADAERAVFTWIIFYLKHQEERITDRHVKEWYDRYNGYFDIKMDKVMDLLEGNRRTPKNAFSFSAEKLNFARRDWTGEPDFQGYNIDENELENLWYKHFS